MFSSCSKNEKQKQNDNNTTEQSDLNEKENTKRLTINVSCSAFDNYRFLDIFMIFSATRALEC